MKSARNEETAEDDERVRQGRPVRAMSPSPELAGNPFDRNRKREDTR